MEAAIQFNNNKNYKKAKIWNNLYLIEQAENFLPHQSLSI